MNFLPAAAFPSVGSFLGFLSALGWMSQCVCSWMGVGRESCRKWDVKHPQGETGLGNACKTQQLLLSDQNTDSTPNSTNITAATSCGCKDSHVERFRLKFQEKILREFVQEKFSSPGQGCSPHPWRDLKNVEMWVRGGLGSSGSPDDPRGLF